MPDFYNLQNGEQLILVRSKIKADSLLEEVFISAYQSLSKIKGKAKIIKATNENYKNFSKKFLQKNLRRGRKMSTKFTKSNYLNKTKN